MRQLIIQHFAKAIERRRIPRIGVVRQGRVYKHGVEARRIVRPVGPAQGGGIEEIERVLGEREPVYRSLASFELDVTNLSVEEAVVYLTRMI